MKSSSASYNPLRACFVRQCTPTGSSSQYSSPWWPMLLYDNYGHVLSHHAYELSPDVNVQLGQLVVYHGNPGPVGRRPMGRVAPTTQARTHYALQADDFFVLQHTNNDDDDDDTRDFFPFMGMAIADYKAHPERYEEGFIEAIGMTLELLRSNKPDIPTTTTRVTTRVAKTTKPHKAAVHKSTTQPKSNRKLSHESSSSSSSSSSSCSADASTTVSFVPYSGAPFRSTDTFDDIWNKLAQQGWKTRHDEDRRTWYLAPQVHTLSQGVLQSTMFTRRQLRAYVQRHYYKYPYSNWNNPTNSTKGLLLPHDDEDDNQQDDGDDSIQPVLPKGAFRTKKTRNISGTKRPLPTTKQKDNAKLMKKINKKNKKVSIMTTPPHRSKPQDPSKPLPPDDDDDDDDMPQQQQQQQEDQYAWRVLWPNLRDRGWTYKRSRDPLRDWDYCRPGMAKRSNAKLGVDYFDSPSKVIEFERQQNGKARARGTSVASPLMTGALRTQSARNKARAKQQQHQHRKKRPPKQWWHSEPVPSFLKDVLRPLQTTVGVYYQGGQYKLANSADDVLSFASDRELRTHLAQHGVPGFDKLAPEQATMVERWVRFAHVPVKNVNSVSKLADLDVWEDAAAWRVLHGALGFVKSKERTGVIQRGEETYESLNALRVHLRGAESLDPPTGGRRRRESRLSDKLSAEDVLQLRLWAALSPTPIVVLPRQEEVPVNTFGSPRPLSAAENVSVEVDGGLLEKSNARRITMDSSDFNLNHGDTTAWN